MTTIKIKNGEITKISITGHADYDPGNDIVCAGISTLAYTMLNYLRQAEKNHWISGYSYREGPGDIRMEFKTHWMCVREITTTIDMFRTGMEMLESQYPDNVRVEVES